MSQAVAGFGVEGQGWDEMIADQHWDRGRASAPRSWRRPRRTGPRTRRRQRQRPQPAPRGDRRVAPDRGRAAAAADRRQRPPAPDRRPGRRLLGGDGVGRRDRPARRHRQRGHRAGRGHGVLPQPAGRRATARPARRDATASTPARGRLLHSDHDRQGPIAPPSGGACGPATSASGRAPGVARPRRAPHGPHLLRRRDGRSTSTRGSSASR